MFRAIAVLACCGCGARSTRDPGIGSDIDADSDVDDVDAGGDTDVDTDTDADSDTETWTPGPTLLGCLCRDGTTDARCTNLGCGETTESACAPRCDANGGVATMDFCSSDHPACVPGPDELRCECNAGTAELCVDADCGSDVNPCDLVCERMGGPRVTVCHADAVDCAIR